MAKASKDPHLHGRVPAWGRGFLTSAEFAELARILTAEVERHGPSLRLDLPRGDVVVRDRGRLVGRANVARLAKICKAHRTSDWPAVVRELFAGMLKIHRDPGEVLRQIEPFEEARTRIKIRLHPESYLSHPDAESLVLRKVADGIAGLLVCDLGFANVSVPAEVARAWERPEDELWALATDNVRAEGRLLESPGAALGLPLDLLASESNYAASHLLFFEQYMPPDAGYGALVGVPQRHVLARHVIRDAGVLRAAHLMGQVIDDWYTQGPGEISKDLYWWRRGELRVLPVVRDRCGMVMIVGEAFGLEVLARVIGGN
jgi:hypothetical protein